MATKSFQTEFHFTGKSARSLAAAIERSKEVKIKIKKPVNFYSNNDPDRVHKRFDSLFEGRSK